MAAPNIPDSFERVQTALAQYKTVRRLLGTVDMITPQMLSGQLVEQINIMLPWGSDLSSLLANTAICDALLYCRSEMMHIQSVGSASGYVHPPEFHQLSSLTMNIHNHRKNLDKSTKGKGEGEAALREVAKQSQREVLKRKAKSKAVVVDSDEDMEQVIVVEPQERSIQSSMHAPNAVDAMAVDDTFATPTQASVSSEAKAAKKAAADAPGTPSTRKAEVMHVASKANTSSKAHSTSKSNKRARLAMTVHTVAGAPTDQGVNDGPVDLEECLGRVRVLQDQEKLQITSARGAQKEKELLLAQLEEHHYHLRYNLRMRDIIIDSLQKWQAKHEPGVPLFP